MGGVTPVLLPGLLLTLALQESPRYVDVHLHLWGHEGPFLEQRSGGKAGKRPAGQVKDDYDTSVKNLLKQMDAAGVQKGLVMMLKENRGLYDVAVRLAKEKPDRFVLVGGGDTLQAMIEQTAAEKVTPEVRRRFEQEARRLLAAGVKAFGECLTLHLSMAGNHSFIQVAPDHPLFLLMADLAAEGNVAIDLHMEAVVETMAVPAGLPAKNQGPLLPTIPPFERLLAHNRKARIVWQHVGWDNTGDMKVELLRRLLKAHANLFMALRVEERPVRIGTRTPMPNRIVDPAGKIKPEWLALFDEFPDRFVIGSDEFFGTSTDPRASPQSFEETWGMVKQLPAALAAKIGRENAVKIYRLE